MLKSVHIYRSYRLNKHMGSFLWDTLAVDYYYTAAMVHLHLAPSLYQYVAPSL